MSPDERRRNIQKRKRSIQRHIDKQVLEEAKTEAKLDESVMDEEVINKEKQVFDIRRKKIKLEMEVADTKKDKLLLKIHDKVKSALDRLEYAQDSIRLSSAREIKTIEDRAARENAQHRMELMDINNEQKNYANSLVLNRQDRQVFHGRDVQQAEEEFVLNIMASETEDLSDDEAEEGAENEDDEEENHDE